MPRSSSRVGAGRRGRPSVLSTVSTIELKQELERRQSAIHELIAQRDALMAEVQELESVFAPTTPNTPTATNTSNNVFGRRGRPVGSGRKGRPRKEGGLVSSLVKVLSGKTLSVIDAEAAVKKAGYKTKSANFRVIVNQALLANPKLFRKVDRGLYTAK